MLDTGYWILNTGPDRLGAVFAHRPARLAAVQLREVRPEHLHVIANLGHGADGGTGVFDRVALLDGDSGRDAFDAVHLRLVHAVEELAGIRGKRFDIAALAFGEEGVE